LDSPNCYRLIGSIEVQDSFWRKIIMVKINGKEVEWDRAPNFVNNIQRKVLWKDEKTGALFAIYRIPKGLESIEQMPHFHPHANQFRFNISGEMEMPNGSIISFSEDDYGFNYCPKNVEHGATPKGVKVIKDWIYLHYFDGADDWGKTEGRE
jgi:hypothetical protein